MNKRWFLPILLAAAWTLCGLGMYAIANSQIVSAQAVPTPVNKPNTRLLSNTPYNQMVMATNFTVKYWVDGKEYQAEYKQEDLGAGAHYKFGFPLPAWIAVEGRYPDGRWKFQSVPMTRPDMSPGDQFAPITGTTLVWLPTGSDSTPTVTPEVTNVPTNTPIGSTVTRMPTPTGDTPTRTPAPVGTPTIIPFTPPPYKGSLTIYGNCDSIMPWSYLYNKVYDANGKLISADKVDCVTYAELRAVQNLETVAAVDAKVPVVTGTLRIVYPTHTPTATLSRP